MNTVKYVPVRHKSRMKCFKGYFFASLVSMAIISLIGCTDTADHAQVALEASNARKGKAAVRRLTDQADLTKVALEARHLHVRRAAFAKLTDQAMLAKIAIESKESNFRGTVIRKLTDQVMLAKVAVESKSSGVREAAVKKLTNQAMLAKFAVEDEVYSVRKAAVENLTDPSFLAKVALENGDFDIRKTTVKKLTDPAMLTRLANINGDERVQLIYKFILAFDTVPSDHHIRIISRILPAIHVLSDPEVVNIVGEIVTISTKWSPREKKYGGDLSGTMPGELFNFSIKLRKQPRSLSRSWVTDFPQITMGLSFNPARIRAGELLVPLFRELPPTVLTKIAAKDKDPDVRKAAQKRLDALRKTGQK